MAKTPKDNDKKTTPISAAAVAIATPVVPAPNLKVAANGSKLKADPPSDHKASSREHDKAFQKKLAEMVNPAQTDPDKEAKDDVQRWMTLERLRWNEDKLRDASDDITYPLLDVADITSKGELNDKDLERADNRHEKVSAMRVLHLREKDGQNRYLVGDRMEDFLAHNKHHNGRFTTLGEAQRDLYRSQFSQSNLKVDLSGPTALNPQLAERMRKNPEVAHYVELTMQAAKKNGLDGVMLANQFWQESRFNPNAKSGAGAMGIAQIMPFHEGKLSGLGSKADFYDAQTSIEAGAQLMGQLSRKYGDQRLALVAYNGGGKAIDFVSNKVGEKNVSFETWQSFMEDRRAQLGTANRGAWHNETLDYTKKIALSGPAPQPA